MLQQIDLRLLPYKERIELAIKAIRSNANLSQQRAATVYNMPETTLWRERAKLASERVISPYCSKLTKQEEEVLV
jgi:DNA-binding transcriptional regulator YiaG